MKCGCELRVVGTTRGVAILYLFLLGLLHAAHAEDRSASRAAAVRKLPAAADGERGAVYDLDQVQAQVMFLSVPAELLEATVADWVLAPLDQRSVAASDPFAGMNQPLQQAGTRADNRPRGHIVASTEVHLPTAHKILDDEQARELISKLTEDERTQAIFSPRLAFIDGMTATAVVGEKKPFVVGWNEGVPQTRVVPQGKMVRLRTVLDEDQMWLDCEIVLSRILDVTTRSIRLVNRSEPIHLAIPRVETTKASTNVELPAGGSVLISGLPAEPVDGVSHELVVLVTADRMRRLRMKKSAEPEPSQPDRQTAGKADLREVPMPVAKRQSPTGGRGANPFRLISKIFDRTAPPEALPAPPTPVTPVE